MFSKLVFVVLIAVLAIVISAPLFYLDFSRSDDRSDVLMVDADRARHGSPARLTFKGFRRWRYDIVLFIDEDLDEDLDRVQYFEYDNAEEQTVLPDDPSWGEWKERYLEVREEAIKQPPE